MIFCLIGSGISPEFFSQLSGSRSGLVRPVLGLGHQGFGEFVPEVIWPMLFFMRLELLCGFGNVRRAVQMIDVLLEFSAVSESAHVLPLNKVAEYAVVAICHESENLESVALARSR